MSVEIITTPIVSSPLAKQIREAFLGGDLVLSLVSSPSDLCGELKSKQEVLYA
jgi:hypothetical protein